MIASTQITNTEIFAFIAVLVFKLLSTKFLFISRKTIETGKLDSQQTFVGLEDVFNTTSA